MEFDLPDRIDVGDVLLRAFTPDDVAALSRAMTESYDHLHPWMAWATPDGITDAACERFVDAAVAQRTAGSDANFGIFSAPIDDREPVVLGGCGLHDRNGPGVLEVGYWLHVAATGKGLMTSVAGTLGDLALAQSGIERVEIHCDEANHASAAVPRRLGYELVSIEKTARPGGPADSGRHMIWARGQTGHSPADRSNGTGILRSS